MGLKGFVLVCEPILVQGLGRLLGWIVHFGDEV